MAKHHKSNLLQLLSELNLDNEFDYFNSAGFDSRDEKQDALFGRLLSAVKVKCGVSDDGTTNKITVETAPNSIPPPPPPSQEETKVEIVVEQGVAPSSRDNFVEQIITNVGASSQKAPTPKVTEVKKKKKKMAAGGGKSSLKQLMAEKRRQKEALMMESSPNLDCFVAVDPEMMIDSLVEVNHIELESLYEVQEAIARGNFGVVHIGKMKQKPPHSVSDQENESEDSGVGFVAIKKLKKMSHANVCAVAREAKVMRLLAGHEGLVQLLDVFEDDTTINLVLEFVAGGDLLHAITLHSSYNEAHAKDMCLQLISALEFMHKQLVVHLDLKPDNLMCTSFSPTQETLTLKVTDFGVSKILSDENEKLSRMCGTPKYSGPEVHASNEAFQGTSLDGDEDGNTSSSSDSPHYGTYHGKPADVWSLGAIVYCLLTGSGPYDTVPASELKEKMRCGAITYDRHSWAPVSKNALQFVQNLCHINPHERPTMTEARELPWFVERDGSFEKKNGEQVDRFIAGDEVAMVDEATVNELRPLNKCVVDLRSSIARRKQSKLLVESLLMQPVEQYVEDGAGAVGADGVVAAAAVDTSSPMREDEVVWPTALPSTPLHTIINSNSAMESSASFGMEGVISPRVLGRTIRTIETPLCQTSDLSDHEAYLNNLKITSPEEFALEVWSIAQDYALHEIKKFTEEETFHKIHSFDESSPDGLNLDLDLESEKN